ncbi:hypothetical protein MKI28_07045 [Streptococcus thermophilus]|nr:hypothetical protein [Streptococcus thermophilus]
MVFNLLSKKSLSNRRSFFIKSEQKFTKVFKVKILCFSLQKWYLSEKQVFFGKIILTVEILLSVFLSQNAKNFPWKSPREAVSLYRVLQPYK